MLSLLKALRSTLKTLNGDSTPASCAAAVLFGALLGLTPFGFHTVLLFALLLVFRVPVGLGMVCGAVMGLLRLAVLRLAIGPLGATLLAEGSATRGLVTWLLDIPVVGLIPLERHAVLGGLVMASVIGALLWYPTVLLVRRYRERLQDRLTGSRAYDKVAWLLGRPPQPDPDRKAPSMIRFKLTGTVLVLLVLLGWWGAGPAVDRALSSSLEELLAEDVEIGRVTCSVFSGDLLIEDLRVGGDGAEGTETLGADRARANVSVLDLLRRKAVIEDLEIDRPRLRLETDQDGKLVILKRHEERDRETGLDPVEILQVARENHGKLSEARDWLQRVRELMAYLGARDDAAEEQDLLDFTELPELGPRLVVGSLRISGLRVGLGDDGPALREFRIDGTQISTDPARHPEPMTAGVTGLLGTDDPANLVLQSTSRSAGGVLRVDFPSGELSNVGVSMIGPLLSDTLPFVFKGGTVALDLGEPNDWITGDGRLDLTTRLILKDIRVAPRPGFKTLAGIDAGKLCAAISDAGTFGLDVRVSGDSSDPQVDVGDTMDNLMRLGAAAFRKQALGELERRYPGIGAVLSNDGPLGLPTDAAGIAGTVGGLLDLKKKPLGSGAKPDPKDELIKGLGGLLGGKKNKKKKD